MPVVLVHGVPETTTIWGPLMEALGHDDVVCLSPPGFGAGSPAGFGATRLDYRDWLVGELDALGGPVDLVGHDWGGGHVVAAALARPDLVRSWVCDIMGVFDPDYVWHDLAQVWQTPGAGEAGVQAMLDAGVEGRSARLAGFGIPDKAALELAEAFDAEMGRCILALYRSAAQPALAEAGRELAGLERLPGLALHASLDHFVGTPGMHHRAAVAAGARVAVLEGLGHWWMLEDPHRGVRVLNEFWDALD